MEVQVIVDSNTHETPLAELLEERLGAAPERVALETGDVALRAADGRTLVIERKAVADLIASYTGVQKGSVNRWTTERNRLCELGRAHPNVTPVLMLHGTRPEIDDRPRGAGRGITGKSFARSLMHTQFNYGVAVVHFVTLEACADWLALAVAALREGRLKPVGAIDARACAPPDLTRKRKREAGARELAASMLAAIPGISLKTTDAVMAHCGSLGALAAESPEVLAAVRVGGGPDGRKLGPKLAALILRCLE